MKKYFLFVLGIIFVVALIYLYKVLAQEGDVVEQSSIEAVKESVNKAQDIAPLKQKDVENLERIPKESSVPNQQPNIEQIYERNQWLRDNGFEYMFNTDGSLNHVKDPLSDYDVYSLETLTAMADGDPRAALSLGIRLISESKHEQAREYLQSAAAHGYARGLTTLSSSYIQEARDLANKKDRGQEADELFVEGYAWGHVMNLRFYPEQSEPTIDGKLYIEDERLQAIKKAAKVRAVELYEELQSERNAMGLGEFNNDIPDSFKQ